MDYCGPRGIPHSRFLSWDPLDQDKALQWLIDQGERCSRCGTYPEDWLEDGRLKDKPPFEVETRRCMGCVLLDEKQAEIPEKEKGVQVFLRYPEG